ncbi:MAG: hypothetical protein RL885_32945 [Planctomycetota bacterium]
MRLLCLGLLALGLSACASAPAIHPGDTPDQVEKLLGSPDEVYFYDGGNETWWVFRPFFGETRLVQFVDEKVQAYSPGMIVSDVEGSLDRSSSAPN